jgi:hypothetical protein
VDALGAGATGIPRRSHGQPAKNPFGLSLSKPCFSFFKRSKKG